jgi:hypothetical protein
VLSLIAAASVLAIPAAGQEGVTPEWQLRGSLDALLAHIKRLGPVLEEVKPGEWVKNGAPDTYVAQAESVRNELVYLQRATASLAASPEQMTVALEAYLKLQTFELLLDSLSEGVRRYQNPALADLLQGLVAENSTNRSRLRSYLVELVTNKELELRIMNEEAQRCRGSIVRQSPPPKKKKQ